MNWYEDIKKYCGNIPIVIFGNKLDLIDEKNHNPTEIQKIVSDNNFLDYYLTSAKTGQGVPQAFQAIINDLGNSMQTAISFWMTVGIVILFKTIDI